MKIICLCGSTKFYEEFMKVNALETLKGNIVVSVGVFGHRKELYDFDINISEKVKKKLDNLHKKKIDISDEIIVINKFGYIGNSTKNEIEYAKLKNKKISYMFDKRQIQIQILEDSRNKKGLI